MRISEQTKPQSQQTILKNSVVRDSPGKGRCLFTPKQLNAGDVIFIEKPTLVAVPSKNQKLQVSQKILGLG